MAALMRRVFGIIPQEFSNKHIGVRFYAKKSSYVTPGPLFSQTGESIAAKGFLRPQKSYNPPSDTDSTITELCNSLNIGLNDSTTLKGQAKFKLLAACFSTFNHNIPNSYLHDIETVGDVKTFYKTPVDATTPLDAMKNKDLPPNLHVTYEYHRFNPETDKLFGGQTAFPESSTIVTGLKYKKKYPGHIATKVYRPEDVK